MLLWFWFFSSFVGKKGKRGFLEYLCFKIWVGVKRISYHLCKCLFSVNKCVNLLLWGETSLRRNSSEERGWISYRYGIYIQLWFRSACNRREVSQESFTGSGQVPRGAFPAEGAAWAVTEAYKLLLNAVLESWRGGACLCLTRILPTPWYSDPQQKVDV